MKRVIRAEERTLWREATRNVNRKAAAPDPIEEVPKKIPEKPAGKPAAPFAQKPKRIAAALHALPQTLDGETASRLKNKTTRPQAKLDLHGMTERAAHEALTRFIHHSVAKKHHLVLIITGKGRLDTGILRRNVPLWLEAPALRAYIIAIAPAFIGDGGDGAYYIQLRRRT